MLRRVFNSNPWCSTTEIKESRFWVVPISASIRPLLIIGTSFCRASSTTSGLLLAETLLQSSANYSGVWISKFILGCAKELWSAWDCWYDLLYLLDCACLGTWSWAARGKVAGSLESSYTGTKVDYWGNYMPQVSIWFSARFLEGSIGPGISSCISFDIAYMIASVLTFKIWPSL